jgi:hypothetical protein
MTRTTSGADRRATPPALEAARSLDAATNLFDRALACAGGDADEVNRHLDAAAALIEWAGPAVAASHGGPFEHAVREAADRAMHSHERLAQVLGLELGRISDELSRLNAGSAATAGYIPRADAGSRPGLDRVG